jgi:hypothetical protein
MTDTTTTVLTDDERIAIIERLTSGLAPADGYSAPPIIGGSHDQPVPEGVSNPYWEIVRRMPTKNFFGNGTEPDGHWCADALLIRQAYAAGLDRSSLCARYAWSIPTPGDMTWLVRILEGRGVVEIGAGSGYWAWQMAQSGIDVVAYDPHPPGPDNEFATHRLYFPVQIGDERMAADHPDCALLLCWPSYGAGFAASALKAFRGDMLVFIGEGHGGCTADDEFFELLDAGWDEASVSPRHVSFWGIHCSATAYVRRAAQELADT